ncbi:MAG: ABC transporter substrate-binding protein [Dehalococcoidia bacterium]
MRRGIAALLIVCLVAVALIPGCQPTPEGTIRVGVIGPMTFIQGEQHWYGAEMAANEINEAGGVVVGNETMQIELVRIDSNEMLSVPDAKMAMEKAITVDDVDFLLGGFRTEAVLAMQDVAMDNQKIFLGCGAADTILCERVAEDYDRYKYWFRVTPVNSNLLVTVTLLVFDNVINAVKDELGIESEDVKVALLVEKAAVGDTLAAAFDRVVPMMGVELVGVWRPSPTATDVTAELSAIKNSGAHIILTYFSGPAGIVYAKQWGELEIPAASVGINAEAQKMGFWDATGGKGNYDTTLNTYARIEQTDKTIPFFDKFVAETGEFPTYTAGTYDAIYILKDAIERAGTLDSDAVVAELENTDYYGSAGQMVFTSPETGIAHDVKWGVEYVSGLGTQWQDGELLCVWPPVDGSWNGVVYEGTVPYKLPPWVIDYWEAE